jgi:glycosyltransferase involved in cell wall biosynthesis
VRVAIDYRPALRDRSGVGEYTHQLVAAMLAAFPPTRSPNLLELSLFSSSWKDRLRVPPELAGARVIDRRVPVRVLNLAWHRLEWPPVDWLGGGSFDVTHSSHPLLMPATHAAQVVTIHDLHFLSHPERTRAEIKRDYPALAREHANRADRVVVSSAFGAAEVQRALGVPAERIAVCPPGAPHWTPRAAAPTEGYLLFFGTLEPRKNVGGLLDAYERLVSHECSPEELRHRDRANPRPLPELVLAGRATPDAQQWLDRIDRPPLKGRVRHIGYVESAKRQELYEGARLLVQPSFEEGFGLPVLEAMSLGIPVVAAKRGSLPEVLGDAGPLVDPERHEEISAAISRLLADDGYAAECRAKGLARARAFDWQRTAHQVVDVYRSAVAERARRVRQR